MNENKKDLDVPEVSTLEAVALFNAAGIVSILILLFLPLVFLYELFLALLHPVRTWREMRFSAECCRYERLNRRNQCLNEEFFKEHPGIIVD
jgi:hypothetical protein